MYSIIYELWHPGKITQLLWICFQFWKYEYDPSFITILDIILMYTSCLIINYCKLLQKGYSHGFQLPYLLSWSPIHSGLYFYPRYWSYFWKACKTTVPNSKNHFLCVWNGLALSGKHKCSDCKTLKLDTL